MSHKKTEQEIKADRIQAEIYGTMTPAQKWREVEKMWVFARELKRARVRAVHPEWSDVQVDRAVKEIFLYATT